VSTNHIEVHPELHLQRIPPPRCRMGLLREATPARQHIGQTHTESRCIAQRVSQWLHRILLVGFLLLHGFPKMWMVASLAVVVDAWRWTPGFADMR
jgi:hypothetical protein